MIPISADSTSDAAKLRKRLGVDFDIYSDKKGAAARAWNVFDKRHDISLSATFIVKKGGQVAFRYVGGASKKRSVDNLIASLK